MKLMSAVMPKTSCQYWRSFFCEKPSQHDTRPLSSSTDHNKSTLLLRLRFFLLKLSPPYLLHAWPFPVLVFHGGLTARMSATAGASTCATALIVLGIMSSAESHLWRGDCTSSSVSISASELTLLLESAMTSLLPIAAPADF